MAELLVRSLVVRARTARAQAVWPSVFVFGALPARTPSSPGQLRSFSVIWSELGFDVNVDADQAADKARIAALFTTRRLAVDAAIRGFFGQGTGHGRLVHAPMRITQLYFDANGLEFIAPGQFRSSIALVSMPGIKARTMSLSWAKETGPIHLDGMAFDAAWRHYQPLYGPELGVALAADLPALRPRVNALTQTLLGILR
jgi:hypothetical protein